MSDENKSDEKLNATTPEFSPDSASAALRAAFLELSKSAWDIEKEIRSSSAELFDSADGYTKLNVGNENEEKSSQDEIEKKVQDEILGDMNGREKKGKQKRNRKRKNEQSRKADAETPLAKTSVSEKVDNEEKRPADSVLENEMSERTRQEKSIPDDLFENQNVPPETKSVKNASDENHVPEPKRTETVTETVNPVQTVEAEKPSAPEKKKKIKEKKSKPEKSSEDKGEKKVFAFLKGVRAKVKDSIAEKADRIEKRLSEKNAAPHESDEIKESENHDEEIIAENEIQKADVNRATEENAYVSEMEQPIDYEDSEAYYSEGESYDEGEPEGNGYEGYEPEENDADVDSESVEQTEENESVQAESTAPVNVKVKKEKKLRPKKDKKPRPEKSGPSYWQRMFESENASQKVSTGLWRTVMGRELRSYFTSPVAYIVTGLFLAFTGFLFFSTFFLENRAELRGFFSILPMMFGFFIPALTMRLFSEEKKSGSLETLMTLPVTSLDVVLGKYLAALISSLVMLVPTLFYVIACNIFGHPDAGPIWGGYIGAVFLASSYTAIGLFSSSITKNQILAFFIALAICMFLTFVGSFVVLLPPFIANLFTFISAASHFDSVARGIIDSRDLIYFVSVTALFVALTVRCLNGSRRIK